MHLLKKRSVRFYLGFLLVLGLTIGGSAIAAFADSGGATATVNAGTLTETGTFGETASTTLDGTDQIVPYTLPIQVKDARGSGTAWHLQISATALSDASADTLTQQVSGATIACAGLGHCSTPAAPSVTAGVITTTPTTFFSEGSAMGIFTVTTTVQVLVPGNASAGTYTTSILLASAAGP